MTIDIVPMCMNQPRGMLDDNCFASVSLYLFIILDKDDVEVEVEKLFKFSMPPGLVLLLNYKTIMSLYELATGVLVKDFNTIVSLFLDKLGLYLCINLKFCWIKSTEVGQLR